MLPVFLLAPSEQKLPSLVFQFPERQLSRKPLPTTWPTACAKEMWPGPNVRARVEQALEDVGLPATEFGARAPFHLSGGEMRRVALAGALAQQRGLVLLDEPTLGLDAEGVARLVTILRMHGSGVAYCVASHDADFVRGHVHDARGSRWRARRLSGRGGRLLA